MKAASSSKSDKKSNSGSQHSTPSYHNNVMHLLIRGHKSYTIHVSKVLNFPVKMIDEKSFQEIVEFVLVQMISNIL